MAGTAARRAENEAPFRVVNERLEDRVLARNGNSETEMEIICECSREECTERIALSVGEYDSCGRGHACSSSSRAMPILRSSGS